MIGHSGLSVYYFFDRNDKSHERNFLDKIEIDGNELSLTAKLTSSQVKILFIA